MPSAVDIIIPAHHAASTIEECLDSVIAQTFQDWRAIVVINQNGYDATMGVVGKYVGADKRITVRYLNRGDLSEAINYGLSVAEAPYIAMLDAGDCYDPRFLECTLSAIRNYGTDLALTDVVRFTDVKELDDTAARNASAALDIEMLKGDNKYRFMNENPISGVLRSNRVYTRKALANVWYPSGHLHEDEYAIYDVYRNSDTVAHIKAPMYGYRITPGSITSVSNPRELMDACRAYSHRVHQAVLNGDHVVAAHALKKMAMDCAFRYLGYSADMRDDVRTKQAFRIAKRGLKEYGSVLPACERMRLGFILTHPESAETLVRKKK